MNLEYVRQWVKNDPDLETKAQLQKLLDASDIEQIKTLFESRLSFGTAGLRAELGPGPMRMNRLVVSQTAQGIANFLQVNKEKYLDPSGKLSAIIGYDARKNSEVFAKDSAEILQGNGIQVELFDRSVATPIVAFTARQKRSSVSIVVTASHNPPNDNGYKVYLGGSNGNSQIVPPQDAEIARAIESIDEINPSTRSSDYRLIGQPEIDLYLNRCQQLAGEAEKSDLKIVYTAMHGVGWAPIQRIFSLAGFESVFPVPTQIEPDPNFPTVDFPNPEEPGAMDLAFEEAARISADLIIANDPDADRLAVAVPNEDGFRMLTGNEVGVLLADYVASKHNSGAMAASYVSSRQLLEVAKAAGFESELTPTGFKWIAKVENLIYGFEEALGYCVDPENTPDKDGLTSALYACLIARDLKKAGVTMERKLDLISEQTGYFETGQISIRLDSVAEVRGLMERMRGKPEVELGGKKFTAINLAETDARLDLLEISIDGHSTALIRASGTEPKLKCYLQSTGKDKQEAVTRLASLEGQMKRFLEQ